MDESRDTGSGRRHIRIGVLGWMATVSLLIVAFILPPVDSQAQTQPENLSRPRLVVQGKSVTMRFDYISFSPDGKQVLANDDGFDGGLGLACTTTWDVDSGLELFRNSGGHEGQSCVRDQDRKWIRCLFPDGKLAICACGMIWDVRSGADIFRTSSCRTTAEISPDGKFLLLGDKNLIRLWVWDGHTAKQMFQFNGRVACLSPNAKLVVTCQAKNAIILDAETGKEKGKLEGHSSFISSVAFSPDSKFIATGSSDQTARIWDASNGIELHRLDGHQGSVKCAFSPSGTQLLTQNNVTKSEASEVRVWSEIRVWDAKTGKKLVQISEPDDPKLYRGLNAVYSPDGLRLLICGQVTRICDPADGHELVRFPACKDGGIDTYYHGVFSPDGARVLLAGFSNVVPMRIFDSYTGREIFRFRQNLFRVNDAAFLPDGKRIVLWGADVVSNKFMCYWSSGRARIWDWDTGIALAVFNAGKRFSIHYPNVVVRNWNDTTKCLDATTGKTLPRLGVGREKVEAICFSPDGRHILSGSPGGRASIRESNTGRELIQLKGHTGDINEVCYSADGIKVATGSNDGTARIWNANTGAESACLKAHEPGPSCVCFSPDGKLLVTSGEDKTTRVWDLNTNTQLLKLDSWGRPGPPVPGTCRRAFFSPNSQLLAVPSFKIKGGDQRNGGRTELWSISERELYCTLPGDPICFSPDGNRLLTSRGSLFDVGGNHGEILKFDTIFIPTGGFSPDGRYLVTTGLDGTGHLWDAATGKELCTLVSFLDGSWAVIDPQGRYDCSNGGEVRGLHWVVGTEPIQLSQLKHRYYEPGLLSKLMGYNKQPLRPVETFDRVALFPAAQIVPPAEGQTKVEIALTNRGGGIGQVQVFVLGAVDEDAGGA